MPIQDPPYGKSYTSGGRSSTITRQVARKCLVCKGLTETKKAECEVCEGKGWSMVWETEVSWDNTTPYIYPQPYSAPVYSSITPPGWTSTTWPGGQTLCSWSSVSAKVG